MGFLDDLSEWGKKLVEGIAYVTVYLLRAVDFLNKLHESLPSFVEFIVTIVASLANKVESGEMTGAEAREFAVAETQANFHGSGSVIPEPVIRQTIEAAVLVEWAKRGKTTADKDDKAMEKGYLLRAEYERARKAWPGLQPLD